MAINGKTGNTVRALLTGVDVTEGNARTSFEDIITQVDESQIDLTAATAALADRSRFRVVDSAGATIFDVDALVRLP